MPSIPHEIQYLDNELCQILALDLAKCENCNHIELGGADVTIGNMDGIPVIVVAPMSGRGIVISLKNPDLIQ